MVGFGLNTFITILLVRKFAMSLAEAAFYSALLGSLPGAIAVIAGGRLADAFGPNKPALYAAIPGWCLAVAAPVYIFGITRGDATLLLLLVFVAALFQYTYLGVTYGVFQNLLHSRMRATGSALLNAIYTLVRAGAGRAAGGDAERRPHAAPRERRGPRLGDGDHRRNLPVGGGALPLCRAPPRSRPRQSAGGRGVRRQPARL
jgi:hypothetical protein